MRRALVAVVTLGLAIGLAACEDTDPVVPGGPTAAPATAAPTATGALPQGVVDVSDTTTVLSAVPLDTVPTTEKPFLGELIDWCVEGQLAACDQVTRWADSDEVYTFGALCGYRLSGVREIMCTEYTSHIPSYGDVETDNWHDLLAYRCTTGELGACDQLLIGAKMNSQYAKVAAKCGDPEAETNPVDVFCTVESVEEYVSFYGKDPTLDAMHDECLFGDMGACDLLFEAAPAASAYRDFGQTCGAIYSTDHTEWCDPETAAGGGSSGTAGGMAAPSSSKPYIQSLIDWCAEGQLSVCDQLSFWTFDQEIVDFAWDCGGHHPGSESACVPLKSPIANYGDFGTDLYLDDMLARCNEGALVVCDQMIIESPSGSEYNTAAKECGGDLSQRGETMWCTGIHPFEIASHYGDDPDLDPIFDSCEAGDMAACDTLFTTSTKDSDYEDFGRTCGGMYPLTHNEWCDPASQNG